MQQHYAGRVTLILGVIFLALLAIFPPGRLFNPDLSFSEKLNLKPGLDMRGGVSLIYEIKPAEGSLGDPNLAASVMSALKKRVDPNGVLNLIWRPQGNRLEIQMPLRGDSDKAEARREAFSKSEQTLRDLNVRVDEVAQAVETLKGDARRDRLNQLAQGSEERSKLFGAMASVWDQIEQARGRADAQTQATLELQYEKFKSQVGDTDVNVSNLRSILDGSDALRRSKVPEIRKKTGNFAAQAKAIEQFIEAHDALVQYKGSLDSAADLKRLLRGSGVLEFHILVPQTDPSYIAMAERLKAKGPRPEPGDTMQWMEVDRPEEFAERGAETYNEKSYVLAYTTPDRAMTHKFGEVDWSLKNASTGISQMGQQVVNFEFDTRGAVLFAELTRNNVQQPLAIVLDDKIISAPNINEPITQGSGQISGGGRGGFSPRELNYLVNTLKAGSLPARLDDEPISERTVGPQLGEDNLRRGLLACVVGLIVVCVFMISYYHLTGVVASIAVLLNVLIILGAMAAFDATFTLPGIAGIALTIGASVDANVLIFERLREEQGRGLGLRMALRNAYDRAFSAILDSNVTTLITALILYVFGSEEVKGFGITLLIGFLASMFTALFVTKTIFMILMAKFELKTLGSFPSSFPAWDRFLHPRINWMSFWWVFLIVSGAVMVGGLAAFAAKFKSGEMLDIEFRSGTQVTFELKEPMKIDEVRGLIEKTSRQRPKDLPSPTVQTVGRDGLTYEVSTPNDQGRAVRAAVLAAMGERLKVELESQFDMVKQPASAALSAGKIVPIPNLQDKAAGRIAARYVDPPLAAHVGGALIELTDISPPLTAEQVASRIDRQRMQLGGSGASAALDYDVVASTEPFDASKPSKVLIVVSSETLQYARDPDRWTEELVKPMWTLVNDAVNKPAQFQGVKQFDPSVAGDAKKDAMMALSLSVIVIMAYIWLRFGNLKFGTATVLSMLHDTFMVIGMVGLSHYLADWAIFREGLLIEPIRLNLTIVAAILTVMGYSMIDTIVVFDRIRENRGKFGHLSRKIVNDSINQTLSRTLLTSGTTLATVLSMYIFGGPGIHGFTFVMLFGIIFGTYSSIAIAAPFLLIGAEREAASASRSESGRLQKA